VVPDPAEVRHVRRRILNDRRNIPRTNTAPVIRCGYFDEKYVETLKGTYRKFTNTNSVAQSLLLKTNNVVFLPTASY
jgi:hypothetical protein